MSMYSRHMAKHLELDYPEGNKWKSNLLKIKNVLPKVFVNYKFGIVKFSEVLGKVYKN